jgi:pimeloyl-ACP methyl ester carboxylesterase
VALCGLFYGRPARLTPEECLESAAALRRAPGFAAARAALEQAPVPGPADTAALAKLPVTVAWGTRDVVLPYRRQARRAREVLPTARHVALPGCGHVPFIDDPAACAGLLTQRQ